ncbi:hypothetical protein [Salibaculum griseiflavum]|nr:hypothetical protein [Salibaculum griseiflavum]
MTFDLVGFREELRSKKEFTPRGNQEDPAVFSITISALQRPAAQKDCPSM